MHTAEFDYPFPQKLIAQTPAEPRASSRLLALDRASGTITHRRRFSRLTEHLRPSDLLVFNDSCVIPARVYGRRSDTCGVWSRAYGAAWAGPAVSCGRGRPWCWRATASP
jgi:S-adenosylmethionine:tRNA ribosyltransferase-isomerase